MVFKIPETRKASAKGEGEKKFSNCLTRSWLLGWARLLVWQAGLSL